MSEDFKPPQISPEGALVANTYLENACSLKATATQLNTPTHEIASLLKQPMIKYYVHSILRETSYRHMTKIAEKLDDLVERKWEELEEAEIGSNKDIADLLALAHKMRSDMAKMLQTDAKADAPATQHNTQINNYGEGNYGALMEKLIDG
jgi:phage terminase small subunit